MKGRIFKYISGIGDSIWMSTNTCNKKTVDKFMLGSIEDILKALRSWLSFNYVKLMRKIKIKNADIPTTLENEEIPTKSKLREVLDSSSARERVMISLVAFAGLRPQVLGKYDSSDGLKLSDIKDLEIKANGADIVFTNIPARIMVRPNLSKTENQYFIPRSISLCNLWPRAIYKYSEKTKFVN